MNEFTRKGDEQVKEKEGNLICWGEWCGKGRISAWVFIKALIQMFCGMEGRPDAASMQSSFEDFFTTILFRIRK